MNFLLAAETTSTLGTLSDMKNLRGTNYHIKYNIKSQFQKYCLKDTKPENEVDDLNPTEDGESSEKAHRASNQPKLRLCGYLENNYQVGNTN